MSSKLDDSSYADHSSVILHKTNISSESLAKGHLEISRTLCNGKQKAVGQWIN